MTLISSTPPSQQLSCDICRKKFTRVSFDPLSALHSVPALEEVSVRLQPNNGGDPVWPHKSLISIEHACLECRDEIARRFSEMIDAMKAERKLS